MKQYTTKTTIYNPHTGLFEVVETTRYEENAVRSTDGTSLFFRYENDELIKTLTSKPDENGNLYYHLTATEKVRVNDRMPTIQLNELLGKMVEDIEENIELPEIYQAKYNPSYNEDIFVN
jgi:hypothetical protein